jgi:hypothetical protein
MVVAWIHFDEQSKSIPTVLRVGATFWPKSGKKIDKFLVKSLL